MLLVLAVSVRSHDMNDNRFQVRYNPSVASTESLQLLGTKHQKCSLCASPPPSGLQLYVPIVSTRPAR